MSGVPTLLVLVYGVRRIREELLKCYKKASIGLLLMLYVNND